MLQGMGVVSFTCDSFHSTDASFLSSLNENYKSKNLIAKEENAFTFLSLCILQPRVNDPVFTYFKPGALGFSRSPYPGALGFSWSP